MNTVLPDDAELERMRAAADWLFRLTDPAKDEELVQAWLQWCEADEANLLAFQRAQSAWQAAAPLHLTPDGPHVSRSYRPSFSRRALTLAASLLIAATAGTWILTDRAANGGEQSYATPVAGLGSSVLPDGSKVELGASSQITTHYSPARRSVRVDAGEAYFTVAKDARRPFVVTAGGVSVTAIGTQFNVRRSDDRIVVAVREGKVQLAQESGTNPLLLQAGQRAVYTEKSKKLALAGIEPEDAASWRKGVLKYVHEPLTGVAADLSRYSSRKILVSDPNLGQLPFTGTVFSSQVNDALRAFESVFPLQVVEGPDHIELRPRD